MDIQTVSTAIATSLAGLSIRTYDYAANAVDPPAAMIKPMPGLEYDATFGAGTVAEFALRLFVSAGNTQGGQLALNTLISPAGAGSAVVALKADKTFGGSVQSSRVLPLAAYGLMQLGDQATVYLYADLVIEVFA